MDIQYKFDIYTSPEKLYNALTHESGFNGWWSLDCQIGEKVGENCTLRFNKEGKIVEMQFQIQALEPNKKVTWKCTGNPNPAWLGTEIQFDIAPSGEGTQFSLNHGKWEEKWKDADPYTMTRQGWDHFMDSLKNYLEMGTGQPW